MSRLAVAEFFRPTITHPKQFIIISHKDLHDLVAFLRITANGLMAVVDPDRTGTS